MRLHWMILCLAAGSLLAVRPIPARAASTTLIRNATVLTVTKGTITHGSVLVRDGKIAEVGENITAPADAKVIDATGDYVIPGIIDCHSHIAAESINEGSTSVSSMVGIEDVINPEDIEIYRALAGGVTTANVLHGSANAIGGKCTVMKMRWGKSAKEMIFEGAMPGIKFALGENPKRQGSGPNPFANTGHAHGSRGRHSGRFHPGAQLRGSLARISRKSGPRRTGRAAGTRSETRTAG